MVATAEVPRPEVKVQEAVENYGKFSVEPLDRGFALTLGNPLRRVLLSALPGTAVTWIRIENVLDEYKPIQHVREDVQEFMLNVKAIRLRSHTDRPGKMRLEVEGQRDVHAGDIMTSSDFDVVNPDLLLATMDSPQAKLSVEFNVEHGTGYRPAGGGDGAPVGVLPLDAVFTPVRKVNYGVERTRVGQVTDYERLVLEVWTDGTTTPEEAVRGAADILVNHFFLLTSAAASQWSSLAAGSAQGVAAAHFNLPVEQLGLTARTQNSLKRAGLNKVGDVLEMPRQEILKTRNFGEKSLDELYDRLVHRGILSPEAARAARAREAESGEAAEPDEGSAGEAGEEPAGQ